YSPLTSHLPCFSQKHLLHLPPSPIPLIFHVDFVPIVNPDLFNMRVSLITPLFICTGLFTALTATAGITENFNSRKGIPIHDIRMSLQNSCWTFHHFDVNNNGWNPKIEGDGAMVSDINALQYGNAGIYTPLLNVCRDM